MVLSFGPLDLQRGDLFRKQDCPIVCFPKSNFLLCMFFWDTVLQIRNSQKAATGGACMGDIVPSQRRHCNLIRRKIPQTTTP